MTPTPEDRLRAALRHEVDEVWPAGSFDDVRRRRRRLDRRARIARTALALVAVVALAGGALVLSGEDDAERVVTDPPTTVPAAPDAHGIWPFTTAAEVDSFDGEAPFDTADPAATAEAFLRTVTGLAGFEAGAPQIDGRRAEAVITNRIGRSTRVRLEQLGGGEHWTVTSLESEDIVVEQPAPGAEVGNPVAVSGRATAFEGTVLISVLERIAGFDRPVEVGSAIATGEQGELLPFATDVTLDHVPDHGRITVVAYTTSAEDGSVDRVSAVPAQVDPDQESPAAELPAGAPLGDDEIAAVVTTPVDGDPDEQAVVVLSATDGEERRTILDHLGTAEGGVLDLEVSGDRRTILISMSTSACTSEILALGTDASTEPVSFGPGDEVGLSPDGSMLATVTYDGCGEDATVELRRVDGDGAPVRLQEQGRVTELVWADDSRLVYETVNELVVYDTTDGAHRRLPAEDLTRRHAPARTADGAISAVEGSRVVLVDLETGAETGEAATLPPGATVLSHWWNGGELRWLSEDGTLFRLVDGEAVQVRTGLAHAAG